MGQSIAGYRHLCLEGRCTPLLYTLTVQVSTGGRVAFPDHNQGLDLSLLIVNLKDETIFQQSVTIGSYLQGLEGSAGACPV